ncbi:lysophospholipase L1-like esterase [Thioflavicoccus mobilis 8321]|uniref:Lysophospholipase L1-like esterase n=1 Tax=Thioflavicoccus mobilis 8321 TaxID=765912 RepID=L0GWY9_9GAMM|nr:lysophospholipase L1-like esterase [Thioflavicoccus mobilis 8321]
MLLLPSFSPLAHAEERPVILILGDSLSAGYGLVHPSDGWVAMLEARLRETGSQYRVVNASISGETTAGGLTRLPALLEREGPELVIIQLGANDGLRGLDLDRMATNLHELIERSRSAGSRVLLVGNRLPPNYGAAYTQRFQAVFEAVAAEARVPLVPALLAGVAEHWDLMQPDGVHPTARAQPQLLANVWRVLAPLLDVNVAR